MKELLPRPRETLHQKQRMNIKKPFLTLFTKAAMAPECRPVMGNLFLKP